MSNPPFSVEFARTTPSGFRIDIQLLRALAILLVLAHHARFPWIPGGFLGVDIFYVVSGYLMTGIIARDLDEGRFDFLSFYARRVRRLLPASFATLVVTAMIAPWLLDSAEYHDFVAQLAGSFGFVANIVLWRQSDYFSTGAALKPLLHMWSLSIEEQYYLVLPLILFLCPARFRLAMGVALTLASGALCLILEPRNPSAAFYLLPTRAWELGLGSVVALMVRSAMLPAARLYLVRGLCLLVLVALPLLVDERGHPGWSALLACMATAILLLPGLDIAPSRGLAPLVAVGNRSYSLYLVHWPVFAFANNIFIEAVPGWLNAILVLVALLWAEAQYRLVEQPSRTMQVTKARVALFVAIAALVTGATYLAQHYMHQQADTARQPNFGLSPSCTSKGAYTPRPDCQTSAKPATLVWGDSLAIALAPALAGTSPAGIEQATMPVCGPFVGIAPVNGIKYNDQWAKRCLAFNDSVMERLREAPHIDTVVMSSVLAQYVPNMDKGFALAVRSQGEITVARLSNRALLAALHDTVTALRAMGKRIIFVAPTPNPGFDMARCAVRQREHIPTISPSGDCSFTEQDYRLRSAPILDVLNIARNNGIPVISLESALCEEGVCQPALKGTILYRDEAHLSVEGSRLLGKKTHLGTRLREMAR